MDELIRSVQRRVHHINLLYHRILNLRLEKTGIHRGQHRILMYLSHREGERITQKMIADALYISDAAVAVSLKKLEKCGYIVRKPSEDDGRFNQVCLTDAGRAALAGSREIFQTADRQMYADFTAEQMQTFFSFLEQAEKNLESALKESEEEQ